MPDTGTNWIDLTIEDPIDPDIPICDPHHHFWDRPGNRYMLDELLLDIASGHNITETVFVECSAMYRKAGPESMRPVGEVEFVQGLAAQSASGDYGEAKIAAGIIGYADLSIGDNVIEVLEAQIDASRNRFRGIRNSSCWDQSPEIAGYKNPPKGLLNDKSFRQGFSHLQRLGLSFDAWMYHTQLGELVDLARNYPDTPIISFTGGTITGEKISKIAAPMFKKLSLELGGKNPNIIFIRHFFVYSTEFVFSTLGLILTGDNVNKLLFLSDKLRSKE